jgi:predicted anti-sigma-YlaC factor YlaD
MTGSDVHARTAERFSAYLEGELPAPEKAAIDEHLAVCIQCRTNLEAFRRTLGNLARLKEKAPLSFLPSIQQQIHARSRGRFFGKRWMLFGRIPFEWVSLAMIVAMLLYYIVTLRSSPTTVTPGP